MSLPAFFSLDQASIALADDIAGCRQWLSGLRTVSQLVLTFAYVVAVAVRLQGFVVCLLELWQLVLADGQMTVLLFTTWRRLFK